MMKLFTYGDSWTEGHGCDIEEENKIKDRIVLQEFRNKYSWPKYLSEKLKCNFENKGWSGKANNLIFNDIINDLRFGNIHEGDFVIVMWSSSLRDHVPFLPKGEWISWSRRELKELPNKFYESYKFGDEKYNKFLEDYKKYYVTNLHNQNYYNIVNQNYIIYLQKMLESYNVKYLMVDAFELMVQSVNKIDDKTNLINKKNYFHFGKKTARDILQENKKLNVWEGPLNCKNEPEVWYHPNKQGYELIGEKIYDFIKQMVL